ncbi:hypothetical protein [Schlesneria paludicola]|uniref:hypothetical protein n=1 Tax=Schlesneria paludicola TaxID=360056 RepID=UPI00029A865B|nr:hypothetical protein [Schlesneria paludicola]
MDIAVLVFAGDAVMHRLLMRTRRSLILAIIAFAGTLDCSGVIQANEPTTGAGAIPAMRRPYQVRLLIAFDTESRDSFDRSTFLRDVTQILDRCAGRLWSVTIDPIDWLGPANATGLDRLTDSFITDRYPNEGADIWFVAAVESRVVGTQVSVRSWQPEVQCETSVQTTEVMDHRDLAVALTRLCRDLFRPMGLVEQVDQQTVQIRLRGGEIQPPDASFAQLAKDDVLLPMFAFRDKNQQIERLQAIPWTFVTVDDVVDSTVTGTVRSGLRMSLGGKKRGRIDTLVVAVRPQRASTVLELTTQSKLPLPLAAHRLEIRRDSTMIRPNANQSSDESTLLNELLTDRLGLVTIPPEADHRLVWLFAYSGENLLARVPFVPGLVTRQRLEVPDDSPRLNAESDLQVLQGEVIDAVALRNTAFATIRAAAKKDDWATVNAKLALLKRQQETNTLLDRLNAVRILGTTAAKARKDRIAEVRINRICDDMLTLIKAHLSPDKLRLLVEEMDALQQSEPAAGK